MLIQARGRLINTTTMATMECFALLLLAATLVCATLDNEYTNSAYLDEDEKFQLHWKINNEKKEISFAVQVKTLGWVGFGISGGTGNMVGSDVVIGWIRDGKKYFKDRYAVALALPPIDKKQDYKLEGGSEENGETVLRFTRKYDTCDKKDNKIEEGTVRVVYAYHTDDPESEDNIPKHEKRGSRSLILRNIMTKKPSLPQDLKHFDLRVDVSLSNKGTTYYCRPFKIPDLGSKKHVVKIEPIITPGNKGLVHHVLVYGCSDDFPAANLSAESHDCYSPNMPGIFRGCIGQSVVAAWAIGGSSFYYPDHVGYPLGDGNGPKYVLFEVHYDNQDKKSGLADKSGLRFHYTSSLRKYDAGILWVGWDVVNSMMVPPKRQNWTSVGYCSANCTRIGLENSGLPEKGIKVFAYLPHSHLLGTGLWTKHVRNGRELPELARDNHYDFNYQEYHIKAKETHVLPGDDIIQYCRYNSLKRTNATVGGLKTQEEMCLTFFYYYPKANLTKCVSVNYGSYYFFKKHFIRNNTVVGYPPKDWTNDLTIDLKKFYDGMKYVNMRCKKQKSEDLRPVDGESIPKPVITEPLKKEVAPCHTDDPSTAEPTTGVSSAGNRAGCHGLIFIVVLQAYMVL